MSLVIDQVSMSYGRTPVLHGVSAEIKKGEFLSILGHSGCGKTTLLKILAGFLRPTMGKVLLEGALYSDSSHAVPPEKRDVGMVFQSFALWPHMTVRQHVEFPLKCRRNGELNESQRKRAVDDVLDMTGLAELQERYPDELSGGQKQRVSLARAIAAQPALLLMDEPLSALDADLRVSMRKEIRRIHRMTGTTVVFVTHDQAEALSLSDQVMVLHEGRVEQIGTPEEIYLRPATKFAASFIGRCNFLKGEWEGNVFHSSQGHLLYRGNGVADIFRKEKLCPLRPEQLHIEKGGGGLAGIIREKQYNGREIHYAVDCRSDVLRVCAPAEDNYAVGEEVYLNCK